MLRRIFTKLVDGLLDPTDYKQVALRADERARRAEDALAEEKLRNQARAEISREDLRDLQVERDRLATSRDEWQKKYEGLASSVKTLREGLAAAENTLNRLRQLPAPERGIVWAMAQVDAGKKVTNSVLGKGRIELFATRPNGEVIYNVVDSRGCLWRVDGPSELREYVLHPFAHVDGWEVAGAEARP